MITGTMVYTWLRGRFVGSDRYGNRYYRNCKTPTPGKPHKRWVLYRGAADGSKVPPEWQAWLNHTVDEPIQSSSHAWEHEHQPNLSGTPYAAFPPGDDRCGGQRAKATGDYHAWRPSED